MGKIFLPIPLILLLCCGNATEYAKLPDIHKKDSYATDFSRPLYDRIQSPPATVLRYLMELDERPDYRAARLSAGEMAICRGAIDDLPPFIAETMKERLLGIYFIHDFTGSGLTEWAVDADGRVYAFMIFNDKSLRMTISELLSWKENSAFRNDDGGTKISVRCGGGDNAFLYILLHESMHAFDYIRHVTPYVDEVYGKNFSLSGNPSDYTRSIWCGEKLPCDKMPFTGKLHFYGSSDDKKLPISGAPAMYDRLAKSPFVSLYGTLSWAEDFAEFGAFYHLTEVLHRDYRITVTGKGIMSKTYDPMNFPRVAARRIYIKKLYEAAY